MIRFVVADSIRRKQALSTRGSKQQLKLSEFCQSSGSLHGIALELPRFSSPPGSASYNKTLRVLQASRLFHISLPPRGIFMNVAENMGTLLRGFDLHPWAQSDPIYLPGGDAPNSNPPILMEISYYAIKMRQSQNPDYICHTTLNCSQTPRIIIQSKHLEQVGGDYFRLLRECHESTICVIWDFSDYHYQWALHKNISDSVMLLPLMHQSLLLNEEYIESPGDLNNDHSSSSDPILPLVHRPFDMVFFGTITERRQNVLNKITTTKVYGHWNVLFEYTTNMSYIKDNYINVKVCLILHSYVDRSAGEYHRLNESATVTTKRGAGVGCVPVAEEFADRIGQNAYQECGGVVFASYNNILTAMEAVLQDINDNPSLVEHRRELHLLWWNNNIRWEKLLANIFAGRKMK